MTLTQTTGTAPLTNASTTLVSNLNADLLDGQQGSYYSNPVGTIALWGGAASGGTAPFYTSLPTGYCLCDGSLLDRTEYASLFTAIGTRYGTTLISNFRLPSFSARLALGLSAGGTPTVPSTLSSGIQSANHNHTVNNSTTNANPDHSHGISFNTTGFGNNHTHTVGVFYNGGNAQTKTTSDGNNDHVHGVTGNTAGADLTHSHTVTSTVGDQSANHSHTVDTVQVYFIIRYL
jgi:microcystin-dependent protein